MFRARREDKNRKKKLPHKKCCLVCLLYMRDGKQFVRDEKKKN